MEPSLSDLIQQAAYSERLIQKMKRAGAVHSPEIEAAFRAVPRHLFLPHVPLEQAYTDAAVITHWQDGIAVSSSSQPSIMAAMLEHLTLRPGQRVLEIGAGTGFNAALIAHLVGDQGMVIAVDVDQDVIEQAAANLTRAGIERVRLIAADGRDGYPPAAPYDRIIVTVAADDIAAAWWDQLAAGGRLVMPFSLRGIDLILALTLTEGVFSGQIIEQRNFVLMRSLHQSIAGEAQTAPPRLHIRTESQFDRSALEAALIPHSNKPQPLPVRLTERELFDGLIPFLALHSPDFAYLAADAALHMPSVLWGADTPMTITVGLLRRSEAALLVGIGAWDADNSVSLGVCVVQDDQGLGVTLHDLVAAWDAANRPRIDQYNVQAVRLSDPGLITNPESIMISRNNSVFTFALSG